MQLILPKKSRLALILVLIMALLTTSVLAATYSWQNIGSAGFSVGDAHFISLALDGSGTPYVAYMDAGNSNKATVMKYDGTNWVTVGSAGFSAGQAYNTSLALDGSGTPYVAYRDWGNSSKATVMTYDGTNWVTVGSAGFSAGVADWTSLALDGSTPYVAYIDLANSDKATVMKYDGTNWVPVGSAGFSAGQAYYTVLALNGSGTPYVVYRDVANSDKVTVMKYDSTNWVTVGPAGFSAEGTTNLMSLALNGSGTPYVAYMDFGNSYKATVMTYDGTNWVTVGSAGFSAGGADYTSLALDGSGTPYVAYRDDGNSWKATVMAFTAPPSVSTSSPANGATIQSTNTLTVDFSEDMLHDGTAHAADSAGNYLLVEANGNGFQTATCLAGVGGNDSNIPILSAAYSNTGGSGPYRTTMGVATLESGSYRLLVCGSASIHDLSGNVLNSGSDSIINFTVKATAQPAVLPQTGFKPGLLTQLPAQRSSEMYQQFNTISLEIPSLGVEAPIVGVPVSQDGWDLTWLGDQAGWLNGTAFPSWAGNSAITAHVVDANGQPGLFKDLSNLKWGDEVIVHAYGQTYVYEVRTVEKYIHPDDTSSVFEHEVYPWLTLITCKGYDEASDSYNWRVVVKAVQTKIYQENKRPPIISEVFLI